MENPMVLESARRHLDKLAPLAKQLNEASDKFTEELKTVEAELANLAIGVEVELDGHRFCERPVEQTNDDDNYRQAKSHREVEASYLAYARHGGSGKWRLMVRTYWLQFGEGAYGMDQIVNHRLLREHPLVESSRELRMGAAEWIEELLEQISKVAQDRLETLKKVTDPWTLPPGWEAELLGQDTETGLVHLMKGSSGIALCGLELTPFTRMAAGTSQAFSTGTGSTRARRVRSA